MTKTEARAWMRRWKIVNDFQREEIRNTPLDVKARQLAAMMRMTRALGWKTSTEEELQRVRDLWVRLKGTVCAE